MAFYKQVGLGLDIPDDHQHQLPAYQPRNAKDLHPVKSYLNKLWWYLQNSKFLGKYSDSLTLAISIKSSR